MEKILAVIGGITTVLAALTLLMTGLNYFIKQSSLVANSLFEIMKYGFKRRRKDGTSHLVD